MAYDNEIINGLAYDNEIINGLAYDNEIINELAYNNEMIDGLAYGIKISNISSSLPSLMIPIMILLINITT